MDVDVGIGISKHEHGLEITDDWNAAINSGRAFFYSTAGARERSLTIAGSRDRLAAAGILNDVTVTIVADGVTVLIDIERE